MAREFLEPDSQGVEMIAPGGWGRCVVPGDGFPIAGVGECRASRQAVIDTYLGDIINDLLARIVTVKASSPAPAPPSESAGPYVSTLKSRIMGRSKPAGGVWSHGLAWIRPEQHSSQPGRTAFVGFARGDLSARLDRRQAGHDLSIPDQKAQTEAWIVQRGWSVAAEYVEPGASATDDKRPQFLTDPRLILEEVAHTLFSLLTDQLENARGVF